MGTGHYSSFIVRLWVESPEGIRWGIIQHVATRDKLRFSVLDESVPEIIAFIRQHTEESELSLPFVLSETPGSDGATDTVANADESVSPATDANGNE